MLELQGKYITYLTSVENQHLSRNNQANSSIFLSFPQINIQKPLRRTLRCPMSPIMQSLSEVKAEAFIKCSSDVEGDDRELSRLTA